MDMEFNTLNTKLRKGRMKLIESISKFIMAIGLSTKDATRMILNAVLGKLFLGREIGEAIFKMVNRMEKVYIVQVGGWSLRENGKMESLFNDFQYSQLCYCH